MALPEGTEGRTLALDALSTAIDEADAQIAATMAIQTGLNADNTNNADGQALKTAVQAVTGTNMKDLMTPDDKADEVDLEHDHRQRGVRGKGVRRPPRDPLRRRGIDGETGTP